MENEVVIKPLTAVDLDAALALIIGYETDAVYDVSVSESEERVAFELALRPLPAPIQHRYDYVDDKMRRQYAPLLGKEPCLGAFLGGRLVGMALAERRQWNRTLWVWELHVAPDAHGRGVGRRLMDALAAAGVAAGMRTIECETQTRNVPAIRFYRRVGFNMEGVDVSFYSNDDLHPDREVAVFMKRRLPERLNQ